jgi:uncharacterized protein (TIRG00374 family)
VKRVLNVGLKLLVSLGLTAYLIWRIDLGAMRQTFGQMSSWFFAAAVLFFVASNALGSFQWYLLLRAQKLSVSFRQALIFYFVGVFFNNVLLGNIGGDALRIYDIKRLTGQGSGGVAATVVDRFIGLLSTCCLALLAYPLIAAVERAWLVSVLVSVWLGLLLILAMGLSRRLGGLLEDLLGRFLPARLGELVGKLRQSIVVYRHQGGLLLVVWLISLVVQFARILVYWCAGLALGMEPGLIYFICFQPVAAILAALPISIGGLGVREGTLVGLFGGVGIARNVAFAMSLLGYAAGILASLVGGVAFVLRRVEPAPAPLRESGPA